MTYNLDVANADACYLGNDGHGNMFMSDLNGGNLVSLPWAGWDPSWNPEVPSEIIFADYSHNYLWIGDVVTHALQFLGVVSDYAARPTISQGGAIVYQYQDAYGTPYIYAFQRPAAGGSAIDLSLVLSNASGPCISARGAVVDQAHTVFNLAFCGTYQGTLGQGFEIGLGFLVHYNGYGFDLQQASWEWITDPTFLAQHGSGGDAIAPCYGPGGDENTLACVVGDFYPHAGQSPPDSDPNNPSTWRSNDIAWGTLTPNDNWTFRYFTDFHRLFTCADSGVAVSCPSVWPTDAGVTFDFCLSYATGTWTYDFYPTTPRGDGQGVHAGGNFYDLWYLHGNFAPYRVNFTARYQGGGGGG